MYINRYVMDVHSFIFYFYLETPRDILPRKYRTLPEAQFPLVDVDL